jgi:hypothetical protein
MKTLGEWVDWATGYVNRIDPFMKENQQTE